MKRPDWLSTRSLLVAGIPATFGYGSAYLIGQRFHLPTIYMGTIGAVLNAVVWGFLRHKLPSPDDINTEDE